MEAIDYGGSQHGAGIPTVRKCISRCFQPDISSGPGHAASPRGPLTEPGTFLISLPSGEALQSAGGIGERWEWGMEAMLWIIEAVARTFPEKMC